MKSAHDLGAGVGFLALGVAALVLSRDFAPEAAAFPVAVAGLMSLLACVMIVRALAGRGRTPAAPVLSHGPRFAIALAVTLAYVVTLELIGFFTASTVFVPVLAVALGFRRPLYLAITTVVFIALLYALFTLLLQRPLPTEFFLAH